MSSITQAPGRTPWERLSLWFWCFLMHRDPYQIGSQQRRHYPNYFSISLHQLLRIQFPFPYWSLRDYAEGDSFEGAMTIHLAKKVQKPFFGNRPQVKPTPREANDGARGENYPTSSIKGSQKKEKRKELFRFPWGSGPHWFEQWMTILTLTLTWWHLVTVPHKLLWVEREDFQPWQGTLLSFFQWSR